MKGGEQYRVLELSILNFSFTFWNLNSRVSTQTPTPPEPPRRLCPNIYLIPHKTLLSSNSNLLMAATTSFSRVHLRFPTNCSNGPALSPHPRLSLNLSARRRSLKALNSLRLNQNDVFLSKRFAGSGKCPRSFVVRCDASGGRVSLVLLLSTFFSFLFWFVGSLSFSHFKYGKPISTKLIETDFVEVLFLDMKIYLNSTRYFVFYSHVFSSTKRWKLVFFCIGSILKWILFFIFPLYTLLWWSTEKDEIFKTSIFFM